MASAWKKLLISLFSLLLLFQCQLTEAQNNEFRSRSRWIPDDAIVQYAGSIGFLSAGAGYSFARGRIETDILLGYLPKSIGGASIWTAALRSNWVPFQLRAGNSLKVIPFTTGLMVSHTFGPNYFVLLPDNYPKNYYTFSTAVHLYYQLGSRIQFPLGKKSNQEMALYYELNSSAEAIYSYIQNHRALSPTDIFFLSLGLRIHLK